MMAEHGDHGVIAIGAVSALGVGQAAYDVASPGEAARSCLVEDARLAEAGLARPRMARAASDLGVPSSGDRATDLLAASLKQLCGQLDERRPGWRTERIGICVGTSSGGMISAERYFASRHRGERIDAETARRATYFAPYVDALTQAGFALAGHGGSGIEVVLHRQIVAACASSTIAIGLATRWLDRDACDLVLAGGYDAISLFVAAGFEAIRATSASLPQPFRTARDGMLLGEGGGMVALVRDGDGVEPLFRVCGFGASADAVHITAPDRSGAGLTRAGRAAIEEAEVEPERIAVVSAHGTATPYNDAAEAKAVHALCAPGDPVVHPFKAQIGHTLGAAGVLETLAVAHAMERGVLPAAFGQGEIDPEATVRLLARAEAQRYDTALKLSAAFGGVTAALVLRREASTRSHRPTRPVSVVGWAAIRDVDREALSEATGIARDRLARIDELGQLALAAAAALAAEVGATSLEGAGVVAGYALATLDTNERFNKRLLAKGPRWVDPRLFPATSPNAGAGHCAIAYGLTGPNFAVNGGLGGGMEALVTAADLIAAGDVDRMIVVSADDAGPAASDWVALAAPGRRQSRGAVAALLAVGTEGREVRLDQAVGHDRDAIGHLALLEWLEG